MELLYLWINESDNGILKKQEVQLSDKYRINVCFEHDVYTVMICKNEDYYNIFKNDVIRNVSALVGENGSGKTTLLNYIYKNNIMPKPIEERQEYQNVIEHDYLKNKTLQVFEDSKRLIIIHNFEETVKSKEANVIKMDHEMFRRMDSEKSYLNSITKIYLTNGNYTNNQGYSAQDGIPNEIALTLDSIKTFSHNFFEKSVKLSEGISIKDNLYNGLQNIIISTKTDMNFQAICDVIYFNKLFNVKKNSNFAGKVSNELHISSYFLPTMLYKIKVKKPSNYCSSEDYPAIIEKKLDKWESFIRNIKNNGYDLITNMKLNFILELDFIYNILSDKEKTKSIIINDIFLKVKESLEEFCDKKEVKYYKNAAFEINKLENIISVCETIDNLYPESDMGYNKKNVINYEKHKEMYLKFIGFIDETAQKDNSFIFKYLKIENLKMSSGERAYLNFFSWLNLLSFFHKISQNILKSTQENILLLIDEIELYCHPEWQRLFLSFLLEELKEQFNNKKIQIIFATHSPIILSDIPLSNTVYMSKNNNKKLQIESRTKHKETFACNIYDLYKDSFFLKNDKDDSLEIIGKLAYECIQKVNNKLDNMIKNKLCDYNDIDYCKCIISIIGEPLIKKILESKLKKVTDEYKTEKLKNVIEQYNSLLKEEKDELIEYIIRTNQEDN